MIKTKKVIIACLNPVSLDIINEPHGVVLAAGALGMLVNVEPLVRLQAEGHEGVGVCRPNVRTYLKMKVK